MANVCCPKCGAKNTEEIDVGKYECPYCGHSFTLQEQKDNCSNNVSAYNAEINYRDSRSQMPAGEESTLKEQSPKKKESKIGVIVTSVVSTIIVIFALIIWIGSQNQDEEIQSIADIVSSEEPIEQSEIISLAEDEDFDAMGGSRTYSGTIDRKYQIVLYVEYDRFGTIEGSYYYEKNGPNNRMTIKGSSTQFDEYNQNEQYCGSFAVTSGEFGRTLEIRGNYTRAKDGNVMPFSLLKRSIGNDMPAPEVQTSDTDGYVMGSNTSFEESEFAYLSNTILDASDLDGKLKGELRIMRNAIFAKYGYIFKSEDLQTFFAKYSWYVPQTSEVPMSILNSNEKSNIELIKSLENK